MIGTLFIIIWCLALLALLTSIYNYCGNRDVQAKHVYVYSVMSILTWGSVLLVATLAYIIDNINLQFYAVIAACILMFITALTHINHCIGIMRKYPVHSAEYAYANIGISYQILCIMLLITAFCIIIT